MALLLCLAACSPEGGRSPANRAAARHGVAELVFFNGTILTMDHRLPVVRAIAVREGRIIALGEEADIEPLTDAGTRLEDLEGKTLIPGLVDARDPDGGSVPPPCTDPEAVTPMEPEVLAGPAEVQTPVTDLGTDLDRLHSQGVTASRLHSVPVPGLPGVLARERQADAGVHLQIAHWPACGARERLILQQVMRDLAQAPSDSVSRLRVKLDPEPAQLALPAAPAPGTSGVAVLPETALGTTPMPSPPAAIPTLPSPWQAMAQAMSARVATPADTATEALRAFTVEGARAMGLQQDAGVLATGKLADVVVLDRNPLLEPPERVAATVVVQTWFAGRLVYERPEAR